MQKKMPDNYTLQARTANPSQDQVNGLIGLYQSGQMTKAEQACRELLKSYPQSLIVLGLLGPVLLGQGKLQEAVQAFDQAIQLKPDFVEAHSNRGVALMELGQLQQAVKSFDKAIQLKPENASSFRNRGVALHKLGQLQQAVQNFEQAIQLKPNYAEAYSNHGDALQKLGQLQQAVNSFDKAIQLKPDYAAVYNNRGNALQKLGQLQQAVKSFDKAIQLQPDLAEAYSNRGVALVELGQLQEAVRSIEQAIQRQPDYAEAYSNHGNALQKLGQLEQAVSSFEKAIELQPDYAEVYSNRGSALVELEQGRVEEAVKSCDQAIQLQPDFAEAHRNRGIALLDLGQLEQAVESFERAIQFKPDYAEAYHNLSFLKEYQANDAQIVAMQSLLTDSATSELDRKFLGFSLAKVYEGLGEYDKSFNYLEQGNRLRKYELNYNIDDDRRWVSKIRGMFTAASPAFEIAADANASIQPIFIVGMPRSGTSLVEQILASHSKVHGAGELKTMGKLVMPILSNPSAATVSQDNDQLSHNEIKRVHDGYLQALNALQVPEKNIADKMPLNFQLIGFILCAFPEAKIIHLNRDPRATCWSIFKHYFAAGYGFAYDLEDLVAFYKLYLELMSFWRERFPNNIYDLCYEDLTENQEAETRKLLGFCDLKWEQQCLAFHQTKRVVKTASAAQVRKKMYQGSSEAWRKYELHLQPLIKGLGY